ncbi:Rad3-related DNA helicase [Evansella vedderi]|uniref:Rad3-related DNA helicase n=1 Tax=Evansella vedderi TaxID=38282 RepID=A0ABT9ZQG0_9BACI|nr:Rad3-related DNA helicase [Evansella vedderi]
MSDKIEISVRSLVEYVYNSGSIDTTLQVKNTALTDGIKTHQKVQKKYDPDDRKEVHLTAAINYKDFTFLLEGRCDGVLFQDGVTIDEIKSASRGLSHIDPEGNQVHWAQAKLYGYMYAKEHELKEINVQVTYADVKTDEIKSTRKSFTFEELEAFMFTVLNGYIKFAAITAAFTKEKINSIQQLTFPFESYRKGQRDMAVATYKTILDDKKLFVKAPTGIGKTVSTIFPTVKAIGEEKIQKLVYITAKTITRTVAEETFSLLREKGLRMKVCTITAKDKICFKEETICQKEYCEFANGYYDRINEAILDLYENEDKLDRETIEKYAKKHTVCPFEFSLDAAMLADAIICDYNYVFDPRVTLKRLSGENKNSYALLVDEAHNLVDRAQTMYSASIRKSLFLEVKREFSKRDKSISQSANQVNMFLLNLKKERLSDPYTTQEEPLEELPNLLQQFVEICEEWLPRNSNSEGLDVLLEAYFEANTYLKINKLYDENYITYFERNKSEVIIKLMCMNPSKLLREGTKNYRGTVFFSATLIPGNYYKEMLGGTSEDYTLSLDSPFNRDQLDTTIVNVSTRFKDRDRTSQRIVDVIKERAAHIGGNILIFFPSYQYMALVYGEFTEQFPEVPTIIQSNTMNEGEREEFLQKFQGNHQKGVLGFAVLGGIFSEGIDLKGDRLKGVIVVGVGLPQFNTEQEIIRKYFQSIGKNGYDYAYVYPGISKVLQAGGRLIRTETDTGQLVLIDDRFLTPKYQALLPYEWKDFEVVYGY